MKAQSIVTVEKYFHWIEKMKPDFKNFYQKVLAQRLTRSSIPVISPAEFDTMHRKYPNAFFVNHKDEIEVKEIDKLPASLFNLNQK
jgi:hypothetical protein